MTFLHLHCHSDRTIGRSLIKPNKLADHYAKVGVSGACLTDNGSMNGIIQLYNACKKVNIKPVIGIEVNVVPNKSVKSKESATVVLIAKNLIGFYNLVKITTIGSMFFYYIPRVDIDVLAKYHDGIIALSSDLRGVAATAFFAKGHNGIAEVYDQFMTIYDGEFYWEIQPTQTESQRIYNEALVEEAKVSSSFKLVASGDPHYLLQEDRELHIQLLAAKNFRNQFWDYPFRGDFHVLSESEMVALFTLLHGRPIINDDCFFAALDQPRLILDKIESFDLRHGTKVPSFVE